MLRDPPLEIAEMDAALLEASIVADIADREDDDHRRNLVKLNERVESIGRELARLYAASAQSGTRWKLCPPVDETAGQAEAHAPDEVGSKMSFNRRDYEAGIHAGEGQGVRRNRLGKGT